MKFSLISLAVLAGSQYGSAFVPGTPSRAFAKMALKSTTAETTTGEAANGVEAADPPKAEIPGAVKKVAAGIVKDVVVDKVKDIASEMSGAEKYLAGIQFVGTPKEAFKGIATGDWDTTPRGPGIINDFTVEKVFDDFLPTYGAKIFGSLLGKFKGNEMEFARKAVSDTNGYDQTVPRPDEYKFFGNGDHEKQLPLFLKTNPFWATALTETADGGFEIKSYDPTGAAPTTLFQEIVGTLTGEGHRVNVQFDSKMEKITGFQAYDQAGNDISHTENQKYWASSAMYNVFFQSSCVHATIHVLHYLMTSALLEASRDYPDMHELAISYGKNIRNKYFQVGLLLITDPNPNPAYGPDGATVITPPDASLITGVNGMGSSQAIRPILENLLNTWGKASSAEEVLTGLMNVSPEKMQEAGILSEFSKHYDLIEPYARRMSKALEREEPKKFQRAERRMERFLNECGSFESNINSVKSWLEIMSATGLIHGGTLSYSRIATDPDVMRWRNIRGTTWDAADINVINGILGTIVGTEEGRHVMGSEMGGKYSDDIQAVLDRYDGKAENLKLDYKKELLQDRETFNEYGFILTDFGPDNFDGKQLTIATYI